MPCSFNNLVWEIRKTLVSPYITIGQIIFHFLWGYCGIFENGILHMYMPQGVSSVANFITAHEKSQ